MMHFVIDLTIVKILTCQIYVLKNVGQGHKVQHSQWSHSMTNINFYKSRYDLFSLTLNQFQDIHTSKLENLENVSQGPDV